MKTETLKNKKVLICIASVILALVAVFAVLVGSSAKNDKFQKVAKAMLAEYPYANYEIAKDGSYLKMDTFVESDDGIDILDLTKMGYGCDHENDTYNGIKFINEKLGFTDAVMYKMDSTTLEMGIQTAENKKYTVTWSYAPANGLEVMYELK